MGLGISGVSLLGEWCGSREVPSIELGNDWGEDPAYAVEVAEMPVETTQANRSSCSIARRNEQLSLELR